MTSNATSWSAAVLLTALVSGCAATPPSAAAPHAEPAAPKAPAKTPAKGSSRVATITPTLEPQAVYEQTRDETGRVAVSPTAVDLAAMPVVALPEPLKADEAPSALPPSKGEPGLEIEKIDSGWRARGTEGNAVYVVIEEPLARLQIGTVAPNRSATSRVYRTCGDHYYEKPMLTPARWETVTRPTEGANKGEVVLTVVDGWFDAKSCKASVVRKVVVKPATVVEGVLYAFRATCDDCGGDRVTFLAPPLNQVAANGLGGEASVSQGTFTLLELPIRKGGAASFTGSTARHALEAWTQVVGPEHELNGDLFVGAEVQQAVADPTPLSIAYATLVRN